MTSYGNDHANQPTPDPDEPPSDEALLALVRTGDWLDAQQFPPTQWAVPGLIPEGFGLLTGPPKIGKSWVVLGIALAVSAGGMALGRIPLTAPRPVLYLALEDGEARLQWRSRQLLADTCPIPALLHVATDIDARAVLPLISAWLDRHHGTRPLVLLDTLGKVMPPALPGEGAYQRDYRIGGVLQRTVRQHIGSTLLVVHHIRKVAATDWMDSTSGTNGLNGSADFTINIHRERNAADGLLRVTGRDVLENEYAVTTQDGAWFLLGDNLEQAARHAVQIRATAGLGDRSTSIVAFVAAQGIPVSPKDVEAALGFADARRYLSRLAQAGRLIKVGRGLYAAPAPPRVAPVPTVPLSPSGQPLLLERHVPTVPVSQLLKPLDTPPLSPVRDEWDIGTWGHGAPGVGPGDNRMKPCDECGRIFHSVSCSRAAS